MITVESAAKYLCNLSNWQISNLKLHKMLYIADMVYTFENNKRLLNEDFEAWDYGPVIPSLYHKLKIFGANRIEDIFWGVNSPEGTPEGDMLKKTWNNLKSWSPGKLISSTHMEEGAWAKNYSPGTKGMVISTQDMIDEYNAWEAKGA